MDTLKIALVTATFLPYNSGTANVCFYNARELARAGHEVHVFTATVPGAPGEESMEGFTIHRLKPLVKTGNAPVLPVLVKKLRGFDIIHLHYPFFGGEFVTLASKLWRIPLVITYHQDVHLTGFMSMIEKVLRNTAGRATLRTASRILFTSLDYGNASFIKPLLKGRENRISELPNGVDTTRFTPGEKPGNLLHRYGLEEADRIIMLVATLDRPHYFKGVDIFLKALAMQPDNVKGVIVGDGNLKTQFEAGANSMGLSSRVFFAGRVPEDVLPDYYRLSDITVLPSVTMGEAFGLVLVEAMACGVPVIASTLPGVRTVVKHGIDGLLVEPGDPAGLASSIQQILDNENKRLQMGWNGREKVEAKYSWPLLGAQLESIYRQVLNKTGASVSTGAKGTL